MGASPSALQSRVEQIAQEARTREQKLAEQTRREIDERVNAVGIEQYRNSLRSSVPTIPAAGLESLKNTGWTVSSPQEAVPIRFGDVISLAPVTRPKEFMAPCGGQLYFSTLTMVSLVRAEDNTVLWKIVPVNPEDAGKELRFGALSPFYLEKISFGMPRYLTVYDLEEGIEGAEKKYLIGMVMERVWKQHGEKLKERGKFAIGTNADRFGVEVSKIGQVATYQDSFVMSPLLPETRDGILRVVSAPFPEEDTAPCLDRVVVVSSTDMSDRSKWRFTKQTEQGKKDTQFVDSCPSVPSIYARQQGFSW
jgi:hypothetical protein